MKLKPAACILLLCGCAASHPDHFYQLGVTPVGAPVARTAPVTQATLKVSVPAVVDRSEMIVNSGGDGVIILEHERWAAPLADLVSQTLARDVERRRAYILVAAPGAIRAPHAALKMAVDVVQVSVRRGARATLEAQWRIVDARTGREASGSDVFSASAAADDYADIARALSECLGLLADRLTAELPHGG